MGIEEIRETTESCKHCYMCRHACPTFLATKLDSHTPRGYALLLSEIDYGFQSFTPTIVDRFYQCSQCGLCREDCAYHWAEDEVVRNGREEIVTRNKAPQRIEAVSARIIESGSPFQNPTRRVEALSANTGMKSAEVLYFAGCSARQNHPNIVSAVEKVLGTLKITWTVLREEGCCGTPLWELGYSDAAKKIAEGTAERIRSIQPKILLSGCPHCTRAFSELYPKWGVALPESIQILHTSQYFDRLLSAGTFKVKKGKLPAASYHDPCQLGRKLGVYEAPRRLIKAATGSKPSELFHSRQAAECCGAGSALFLTDPALVGRVAEKRLASAAETGSRLLITACQNCKGVLSAIKGSGCVDMEILDLVEILARSL